MALAQVVDAANDEFFRRLQFLGNSSARAGRKTRGNDGTSMTGPVIVEQTPAMRPTLAYEPRESGLLVEL